MPDLPLLGASLPVSRLPEHRDWLCEHGGRDLELQDAWDARVLDEDFAPLVEQVREGLEGHGGRVGLHGPFDGYWTGSSDPTLRRFVASRFLKALEFGAEVGATHLVVHSPFGFFGHAQMASGVLDGLQHTIGCLQATLEPVLPVAERLDLVIVIENILDAATEPLLAAVRSFNSKHVRLSVDVGHANLMSARGGPSPEQWVSEAGPLLGHLHLQDTDLLLDRHWRVGWGTVDWRALFSAIHALECYADGSALEKPRLILEVDDVLESAAWLSERGWAR